MVDETKIAEQQKEDEKAKEAEAVKVEADKQGTVPEEIELAKKHGFKPEIDKEEVKKDEKETDEKEKVQEVEAEEIRKKPLDQITDEESKKLTKNEQGYYWAAKKERIKRQQIESDKQFFELQNKSLKEEEEKLRKELEILRKGDPEEIAKLDEDKPKDGRLTKEEWQAIQDKKEQEQKIQKQIVDTRLAEFEIEAKERYEDFNSTIDLATDIFNNYKTLFTDSTQLKDIEVKLVDWTRAAADVLKENPRNVAILAYEIGKLHPKYKTGKEEKKKDGDETLTDEKMKKLMDNQKKGRTSASLGGSGASAGTDITPEMAAKMSISEWRKLPKDVKERILRDT
jgi:hypothetical protein